MKAFKTRFRVKRDHEKHFISFRGVISSLCISILLLSSSLTAIAQSQDGTTTAKEKAAKSGAKKPSGSGGNGSTGGGTTGERGTGSY